jgi:nucleoside triphosphate pyrophosphatase
MAIKLKYPLVLGSASPRRKALLQDAGFTFEVVAPEVDESIPEGMSTDEAVKYLARIKAENVAEKVGDDKIIIGADTIVVLGNRILGKPKNGKEAKEMLRLLSGKTHEVKTGGYILGPDMQSSCIETTAVTFYELTNKEINDYVKHCKPFDKAGAYAIQEWIGMIGVEKIDGCYFNVVGLPVARIYRELQDLFSY